MATIRERKSDRTGVKSWQVCWRENGRQVTWTLADEPSALRFKATLIDRGAAAPKAESYSPIVASTAPGLGDWFEKHITDLTRVTIGTKDDYRKLARRTYVAELGNVPVDQLTRSDVAAAVNALSGRLAPKSVRNAHGLLVAALDYAVRERVIVANPARDVRPPEKDPPEIRLLTDDEVTALLVAMPDQYRPLIALIACTRLRFGEATALTVADINLDTRMVRVHRAWKKGTGSTRYIGRPKSPKSRRTVGFRRELLPAIEPLVRGRKSSEYVFTTTRGTVVTYSHFHARVWKPACERAELVDPRPTPHGLRHYHASFLVSAGVPLAVVQARLGHEDISTTVGTYSHLEPAIVQAHVDAAEMGRLPQLGR